MKGEGLKRCSGTWPQVDIHGNIQDVSPPTRRRLESKSVFIRRIVSAPRCSTAARLHGYTRKCSIVKTRMANRLTLRPERALSGLLNLEYVFARGRFMSQKRGLHLKGRVSQFTLSFYHKCDWTLHLRNWISHIFFNCFLDDGEFEEKCTLMTFVVFLQWFKFISAAVSENKSVAVKRKQRSSTFSLRYELFRQRHTLVRVNTTQTAKDHGNLSLRLHESVSFNYLKTRTRMFMCVWNI